MRRHLLSTMARGIATALKAAVPVTTIPGYAVNGGRWGSIRESFAGAFQRDVVADPQHTLLAFSAVFACTSLIANDIAKLRPRLMTLREGVWTETTSPTYSPVLARPNRYQNRVQFLAAWIQSKLIAGNAYTLLERDARGVVIAMYVLNPQAVKVLVTEGGDIYYEIGGDRLLNRAASFTVPQSEILHDRTSTCLFHPLIGVGPIYACGISATQGNRIQANSARFFANASRPGGMLTAPSTISDETAARLKAEFEGAFSGSNIGRLLVTGDGLKYEPMTIPAQQAQMIEQLRWTVEDVARCFMVPLHKIAAGVNDVKFSNMVSLDQSYFNQTLGHLVESIEVLLDQGLGLTSGGTQQLSVQLDLEGMLRMDPLARAERNERAVRAGYMSPDEARKTEDLLPLPNGIGAVPWLQMQDRPMTRLADEPMPASVLSSAPDAAAKAAVSAAIASLERRCSELERRAAVG